MTPTIPTRIFLPLDGTAQHGTVVIISDSRRILRTTMQPTVRICVLFVVLGALSTYSAETVSVDTGISEKKPLPQENVNLAEGTTVATDVTSSVSDIIPAVSDAAPMRVEKTEVKENNVQNVNTGTEKTEMTGESEKTVLKRDPEDLSGLNYIVEEAEKKFEAGLPNLQEASNALDAVGKSAEALVLPEDAIKAEPELLKAKENEEKLQQSMEQQQQEVKEQKEENQLQHQNNQQQRTSSLRSSEVDVVHSVNNVNSVRNVDSRFSLQATREENEEWYDTFGDYKFEMVSTPTRWLELNLCSYNTTTGTATVGVTSMIPLDVCHLSAHNDGKFMGGSDQDHTTGHHISYKANITANGLLSIFYDYDCDDNTTSFNNTLKEKFLGHINTTESCSWDAVKGDPMYSAKIHEQTTIPSPPSYNGHLEKWYSDASCSTMSGWSFVKSNSCVRDKSRMFFATSNPNGSPFYISASDGTAGSGGEIVYFGESEYYCNGTSASKEGKLGTFGSCTSGLQVLKNNPNNTVIGEIGLGSHFKSSWLPNLDESKTDAVDIALTGDVDALSALMDSKGVEFLMQDNFGETAASISSVNGNLDSLKLLVTRGKIPVDATGNTGNSLLTWAAKYGKIDVVNYLITQDADLYIKNNDGKSALMLAYENGYRSIANALLAAGASVF